VHTGEKGKASQRDNGRTPVVELHGFGFSKIQRATERERERERAREREREKAIGACVAVLRLSASDR
jgi:hypothetical protein